MISQHRHTGSYVSKLSNKLRRKLDMLSSRGEFSGSRDGPCTFYWPKRKTSFKRRGGRIQHSAVDGNGALKANGKERPHRPRGGSP